MNSTITNGNGTEPDANAAALEALEAEAKRAGIRLPRRGEDRDLYVLAVARNKGALYQDEHVPDPPAKVQEMLSLAKRDELYGHSPGGVAVQTAVVVWGKMHPEIKGIGDLGPISRTGIRSPIALILRDLIDDPSHAQRLSAAETELLRVYTDDALVNAIAALEPLIAAAHERIRDAAETELAGPVYDLVRPTPPPPLPEPVPMGRNLQLNSRSLKRITSAAELREDDHGI